MTLNVLWSDERAAYVIADSARSHRQLPLHSHSLLQQLQRVAERDITVEEGAQKIVPLSDGCVATLCGNAYDAQEFVRRAQQVARAGDMLGLLEHLESLSGNARFVVGITEGNHEEAIHTYAFPEREILITRRGEIKVNGRLADALTEELANAICNRLVANHREIGCEWSLVGALAMVATIAAQENLIADHIGGACFGAYIENGHFRWQPDVSYAFYSPHSLDLQELASQGSGMTSDEIFGTVHTLVRDNASCAATASRCVVAISDISASPLEWVRKWKDRLNEEFGQPEYVVFVPIHNQGVTVVAKNMGEHCRVTKEQFAYTSNLRQVLEADAAKGGAGLLFVN